MIPQQALQQVANSTGQILILDANGNPIQQPVQQPPQNVEADQNQPEPEPTNQSTIDPRLADPNSETWMQKFQVIDGKYKAEVKPLYARLRAIEEENAQLKARIESGQAQKAPAQQQSQIALTKEDLELLDEEGVSEKVMQIIGKVVDGRVRQSSEPIVQNLNEIRNESAKQRSDRFFGELDDAVPDWEVINQDPRWHEWLSLRPNDSSPFTRNDSLKHAEKMMDSKTIISLLKEFKGALGMPVGSQQRQQQQQMQNPPVDPMNAQANQIPTNVDLNAADLNNKIWTKPEIKQFYTDQTRGKYTPEAATAIDQAIAMAAQQGRIR